MQGTWLQKTLRAYTRHIDRALVLAALVMTLVALGTRVAQAQPPPAPAPGAAKAAPASTPTPTPAPAPGAVAPAPVRPPSSPGDREWLKSVYESVADSVVLIDTETGTGSGFFFYGPGYVATALHVVDDAETIIVNTMDGRRYLGSVVAYSRDHDVALVELAGAVPGARVLPQARGAVEIGEIVAVIGHPFSGLEQTMPQFRGLLNWSLTQGIVGAVSASWIQTDAAINPGNSGGPVLNARGEVIGVVSAKLTDAQGIGMIARIDRVEALVPNIGKQPPPRKHVAWDGIELGFLVNWADESIDGLGVGFGVRFEKRYPVRLRLGFLGGEITPESDTIVASHLNRFSTELTVGYAVPFGEYFELSPTLGAALFYDRRHDSALRIDSDVTCTAPPCLVDGKVVRSTTTDWRFLPTFGASLDFVHLRVAYAYQLDLSDAHESEHRLLFALAF